MKTPSLTQQIDSFLSTLAREPDTLRQYRFVLERKFLPVVGAKSELTPDSYSKFLISIKHLKDTTQTAYTSPVIALYTFWETPHLATLKNITKHLQNPNKEKSLIKFNRDAIEKLIEYCNKTRGDVIALRNRAFIFTAVDTGGRIGTLCRLKRGDIDWQNRKAIIRSKRKKHIVIRFSPRSIDAIKKYLQVRDRLKKADTGTALANEPLFASHGINANKRIFPIGKDGISKSIKGDSKGKIVGLFQKAGIDRDAIRMHDLRHYFVTLAYEKHGLKAAQELANHENIETTNKYSHIAEKRLDSLYDDLFN